MLNNGLSFAHIHKDTLVGLASISRIHAKHTPDLPKSVGGAPPRLSAANIDYVKLKMRMGKMTTAVQAARALQDITNKPVSPQTVCRGLKNTGWRARRKVKRPALEKRHIRARLEFAERHLEWTVEDWKRVWWSDETKVNRYGSDGNEMVWGEKGEGLNHRGVKETRKFGGGSIMMWGCMGWEGVGYAARIEGKMDAELYRTILEEDLLNTLEYYDVEVEDMIFQQDNDPKHTSKKAKEWFQDHTMTVLIWPANSPDMNPIEHLWVHVKNELKKYDSPPSGVHQLWERVEKVWEAITPKVCQNLIESMPRRIQAVVQAKGKWTKY